MVVWALSGPKLDRILIYENVHARRDRNKSLKMAEPSRVWNTRYFDDTYVPNFRGFFPTSILSFLNEDRSEYSVKASYQREGCAKGLRSTPPSVTSLVVRAGL
jgi:hypothetical protein